MFTHTARCTNKHFRQMVDQWQNSVTETPLAWVLLVVCIFGQNFIKFTVFLYRSLPVRYDGRYASRHASRCGTETWVWNRPQVDLVTFDLTWLHLTVAYDLSRLQMTSPQKYLCTYCGPVLQFGIKDLKTQKYGNMNMQHHEWHEWLCVWWRRHLAVVLVRKTKSITLRRKTDELKSM